MWPGGVGAASRRVSPGHSCPHGHHGAAFEEPLVFVLPYLPASAGYPLPTLSLPLSVPGGRQSD